MTTDDKDTVGVETVTALLNNLNTVRTVLMDEFRAVVGEVPAEPAMDTDDDAALARLYRSEVESRRDMLCQLAGALLKVTRHTGAILHLRDRFMPDEGPDQDMLSLLSDMASDKTFERLKTELFDPMLATVQETQQQVNDFIMEERRTSGRPHAAGKIVNPAAEGE